MIMNISDDILIQHAQQGNERAFAQLVERYHERIFNVCFRIVGNFHDAEEATMDTFLACYRSLDNFEGRASFATWVYRIAIRCAYRYREKRPPESLNIGESELSERHSNAEPDKILGQAEIQKAIEQAMGMLPDRLRDVTVLYFLEGLSYSDIAEILECPIGTVGSRINSARRYMKQRLGHLIKE
jgi:RNA polymerase sigma-70 factor (ECF subfamily)